MSEKPENENNDTKDTWCIFCGTTDRYRLTGWTCTLCDRNGVRQIRFPPKHK